MFSNQCKKESLKSQLLRLPPQTLQDWETSSKMLISLRACTMEDWRGHNTQKKKRAWAPSNTKLSIGNKKKKRNSLPKFKNVSGWFSLESSHSQNEQNPATKWSKASAWAPPHTKPSVGDYYLFIRGFLIGRMIVWGQFYSSNFEKLWKDDVSRYDWRV